MAEAADYIRDAILKFLDEDNEGPFLIGDLVLITEITNAEGVTNLLVVHNTEIAHWTEIGFLHDRLDAINQGNFILGENMGEDNDITEA